MKDITSIPLVIPLRYADSAGTRDVGGKSANLARMVRSRLPVPDGFCIRTAAFDRFLESVQQFESSYASLEELAFEPSELVQAAAAQIRQHLAEVPIPADIVDQIISAWQALGADLAYAVRSSATAEDQPQASCAGQHDTFLNVRGRDALLAAVRRCWISLFADRAVLYRMRNRIPQRSAAMAVTVQQMVPADAAGVVFTADPLTGDRGRIVIEATWGLGETLVLGKVAPDRIVFDKRTLHVIESSVGRKAIEIVPDTSDGVRQQAVVAERQDQPCLHESLARHLGKMACQAERLFGCPQDLEWASSGGRMFLLQSRPITFLPTNTQQEPDVWSNVGTGEVLPDVVTPMSWSVLSTTLQGLFDPILRHVGVDLQTNRWLGLVAGRVYMNVKKTDEVLRSLPGPSSLELTESFGGRQAPPANASPARSSHAQQIRKWRRLPRLSAFIVRVLFHATERRAGAFVAQWRQRADELTQVDTSTMSDEQLAAFIPSYREQICSGVGNPAVAAAALGCIGTGLGCAVAVFRLCRRWLDDQDGTLANRLLSGAGGMDSAESALDLWRLAEWARKEPAVARVLHEADGFASAREQLERTPNGREFLTSWETFMTRHGHHAQGEMDVHNPRWLEKPDYILNLVRGYLRMSEDNDPLKSQEEKLRQRQELFAECRKRLRNPLKRWLVDFLVHKGRRGLAARENCKSDGIRMIVPIRWALLESGRRLTERGTLSEADDVFFLEVAELSQVLAGCEGFDIGATIAARKATYAYNRGLTPPPVVVGKFDPDNSPPETVDETTTILRGLAVSPGVVTGRAHVILRADGEEHVLPGEILVAPFSDPGWTPQFLPASAIVMELGGQLSHGSVLAREYGLPAVVNVRSATRIIRTGQLIRVDGYRGMVTITGEKSSPT